MNTFQKIIKEICKEEKIKMTCLSKDWIICLERGDKLRFIAGYKFDLNRHGLGMVLDDKYAMFDVLKYKGLPIIEHHILYGSDNTNKYASGCNSFEDLKGLFYKYNQKVVLKPNNGTCGIGVNYIENIEDLKRIYNEMIEKNFSISVCPFYDIETEFRTIILNNKIKLVYGKIRPIVVGDGKSTIKELLINFNESYFKNYNKENSDIILKRDEVFEYDWKFNLSRGSKMFQNVTEKDYKEISFLALKTSYIVNLGFGSVDIIKTKDGKYYVMEINSGVMMDNFIKQAENGYNIAKDIYRDAVKSMFV